MKAATVSEIKNELKDLSPPQLIEFCLRLARFKKENKELLTYLLFEASDLNAYITGIKEEIDTEFAQLNISNLYYAKKGLRRILRTINKYIRYTGDKTAEVEILLHYSTNFRGLKIGWEKSTQMSKLFASLHKKIEIAIDGLHEDLQYEYRRELDRMKV